MSTKERILDSAVNLFSEKGFSATSIREIAYSAGIKESSLYNHFAGKQQILDEIFDNLERHYEQTVPQLGAVVDIIAGLAPEELIDMNMRGLDMFLGNPPLKRVLRILSVERFVNPRAKALYIRHVLDEPIRYQAQVFSILMDRGLIPEQNPSLLAREFYSYILYIYFRHIEMEKDITVYGNAEFRQMIKEHMAFLCLTPKGVFPAIGIQGL